MRNFDPLLVETCETPLHSVRATTTAQAMQDRTYKSDLRQWRAWVVVFGGALVHLTLGTLYTFGNMSPYITSYIRKHGNQHSLTYGSSVWIYAAAVGGQGSSMVFGGLLGKRIGPRMTTALGCLLTSGGVALTFFTIHDFRLVVLTYGFMFGIGVGLAYVNPLACAMKWMPSHRGFANGVVVAGFGAGALIFDQVQTFYINPTNKHTTADPHGSSQCGHVQKYFEDEEVLNRVPKCFLILALVYAVMQAIGVIFVCDPPDEHDYTRLSTDSEKEDKVVNPFTDPDGDASDAPPSPSKSISHAIAHQVECDMCCGSFAFFPIIRENEAKPPSTSLFGYDLSPKEILRTWTFYILWLTFLVNGLAVVYVATLYKTFGQTFINNDHFLAVVGTISSPFNAFSRILWGAISDRFSYKMAMLAMTTICSVLLLTFYFTLYMGRAAFAIWVPLLFLCLGGNFSMFPFASATAFGNKSLAANYGLLFTSQVVAGVVGATLTSNLICSIGYSGLIPLCASFQVIGVLLTLFYPKSYERNLR